MRPPLPIFAVCAAGALGLAQYDAETAPEPLPGLQRVIVLARHGNRAPNPQIELLCPNFWREVLPQFGVAPAALSRVGMAENWENGQMLRHRYRGFLPLGPYNYDGTYSFFSEREERNIVSTTALAQGLFPPGTGLSGYSMNLPNYVPIATTQDGADVLMNCPRDGPCQAALARDKAAWARKNEARIFAENRALFGNVSAACGYELGTAGIRWKGKAKGLTWAAKAVADALIFAENEGLDATMGGRLAPSAAKAFAKLVTGMVEQINFGEARQVTYWAGDFVPTLLKLSKNPLPESKNKLHVFLNHRELIYVVAKLMDVDIEFPGAEKGVLPSGCSLLVEVYEEGVRIFLWAPSKPGWKEKSKVLREGEPTQKLFRHGALRAVPAASCKGGEKCPVETLARQYLAWVHKTGSYVQICNVSKEETYFAKGEASLGIMEKWVQPGGAAPEAPSGDGLALAEEAVAEDEVDAVKVVEENSWAVAGVGAAGAALALLTGWVGFQLGRRAGRQGDEYLRLS